MITIIIIVDYENSLIMCINHFNPSLVVGLKYIAYKNLYFTLSQLEQSGILSMNKVEFCLCLKFYAIGIKYKDT